MSTIGVEVIPNHPAFQLARESLLSAAKAGSDRPVVLGPAFGLGALRDGVRFADMVDQPQWESILAELVQGGLSPDLAALQERLPAAQGGDPGVTPIGLINLGYLRPRRSLSHALLLAERDDGEIEPGARAASLDDFERQTAFAAAALLPPVWWGFQRLADQHRGLQVRFRLAPELLVGDSAPPEAVEIDFDDGEGFRPMAWGGEQVIDYDAEGDRRLLLRATTADGVRSAAFKLVVVAGWTGDEASLPADRLAFDSDTKVSVTARISYQGVIHGGVAHVYWGRGNTSRKLRRPILLAEGFPGGNPEAMIYNYFDGWTPEGWNPNARLAGELRDRGYDVVILTFGKAGTAIQGNAFVYLRALQWMREESGAQVAALGGSMGGLIARYALAYAEHHGIDIAWVSRLITFDSPHCGGNLPLSVQFTARYFQHRATDTVTLLNYDCARQMLMHQYWGGPSEPTVKETYTNFYAELEGLARGGFPAQVKKYAVCNGARDGTAICPPESHALTARRTGLIGAHYHAILYTTASRPLPQPVAFANCYISELGYTTIYSIHAPDGFYSRDGCAGGRAPHVRQTAEALSPTCANPTIDLHQPNTCFIPAYSALGIKRAGEAYGFRPADLKPGETPFDEWYATAGNTQHCTINEGVKSWVLRLFPAQVLSGADRPEEAAEAGEVLAE